MKPSQLELKMVRTRGLKRETQVLRGGVPLAVLDLPLFGDSGGFEVEGEAYTITGMMWSRTLVLSRGRQRVAKAHRLGWFGHRYQLEAVGGRYLLGQRSWFGGGWRIERGGKEVGAVLGKGALRHHFLADLPPELPLAQQVFVLSLVSLIHRRNGYG